MSTRTGYYYSPKGELRHCHGVDNSGTYRSQEWHVASNVHPATPRIHYLIQAFNTDLVVWAKANADLTSTEKSILIGEAEEKHAINTNKATR